MGGYGYAGAGLGSGDSDKLDAVRFAYWVNTAEKFSHFDAILLDDIEKSQGRMAQRLTRLFNEHNIKEVSLVSVKEAFSLANEWLETGAFDRGHAELVGKAADETLAQIMPLIACMREEGTMDENGFGMPLVLAAIGNARDIVNMLVGWDAASKIQDQSFREGVKETNAYVRNILQQAEPPVAPKAP